MSTISNSQIEQSLRPYGVAISPEVIEKIGAYISLLLKWNRKISLTTVTDPAEILKFHFGESIFATSALNFSQSRLADVGSGAGFPGLPLAMVIPDLDVTLIESNTKKCAFLAEVTRELQIANVTVFRGRMEDLPESSPPFEFIAARALGHHEDFLVWSMKRLTAHGKVVLWIGDDDARELSLKPDWNWNERILIPGSERRFLLVGAPKS
jgi:16S rRNA (guanine527-N7)-methyltransferase